MKTATKRPRTPAHSKTADAVIERGADGRLHVHVDGATHAVRVRRCFPWTEPGRFISLRTEEDREVALIAEPAALDDASRRVLEDALAEAGFLFDIVAVLDVDEEIELRQWRVRCVQGARTFQTRLDEWPRRLPDGRVLLRDLAGDLYRLPDPRTLDARSRRLLWAFVD